MTESFEPVEPLRPYADEPIDPPAPNRDDEPRLAVDDDEPSADGADPRIDAAVARLDALGDAPPAEHVEVYEDVHRVLQDALADAARDDRQQ